MSCSSITSIPKSCITFQPGINKLWMIACKDIKSYEKSNNIITSIDFLNGASYQEIGFIKESAGFDINGTSERRRGILVNTLTLNFNLFDLTVDNQLFIKKLIFNAVSIIARINNKLYVVGLDCGLKLTAFSARSGKSSSDEVGYNLTFTETGYFFYGKKENRQPAMLLDETFVFSIEPTTTTTSSTTTTTTAPITTSTTTTTTTIAATASITINYYNDIEKPLNIGFRVVRQPLLNIPTGFTYLMEPFDYETNSSITLRYTGPTLSQTYLLPATYSNTTYNFQTYYNPLNVYHNYTFPGHSTNVDSGSFSSTQRVKKLYLNNILLDTKTESNIFAIGPSPSSLNFIYGPINLISGFTLSHFDHITIDMFEKIVENTTTTTSTTTTTTTLAPTTTSTTTSTTTLAPTTTTTSTTTSTTTAPTTTTTSTTTTTTTSAPGLDVNAKFINGSDTQLDYYIYGAGSFSSTFTLGNIDSASCIYFGTIGGLNSGDVVYFQTQFSCALALSTTNCPNTTTSCLETFTYSGPTTVYVTVDGSNCC